MWQVFDFLMPLVQKLPESDQKDALTVLGKLRDPMCLWHEFLKLADGEGKPSEVLAEDDDDVAEPAGVEGGNGPLEAWKQKFNKSTGQLLDFVFDLMQGKYLDDFRELCKENEKIARIVAVAKDDAEKFKGNELLTQISIVVQAFDTAAKSVSIAAPVPAPSLLRSLDGSDQAEEARAAAWKQVQQERKKFISLSTMVKCSKDSLNTAFRQSGKVWSHGGTLNASHRLVIAAADLLSEAGNTEPWLSPSPPSKEMWTSICEFCASLTGPTDFALCLDGRMREAKRIMAFRLQATPILTGYPAVWVETFWSPLKSLSKRVYLDTSMPGNISGSESNQPRYILHMTDEILRFTYSFCRYTTNYFSLHNALSQGRRGPLTAAERGAASDLHWRLSSPCRKSAAATAFCEEGGGGRPSLSPTEVSHQD